MMRRAQAAVGLAAMKAAGVSASEAQQMGVDALQEAIEEHSDPAMGDLALMAEMIESWTFTYADGQPVPVTAETVAELSERTGAWLLEEIDKRGGAAPIPTTEVGDAAAQFQDAGAGDLPALGKQRGKARMGGGPHR
jgi:hypothetical protein